MITGINIQDTVKPTLVIRINTEALIPDSVFKNMDIRSDTFAAAGPGRRSAVTSPSKEVFVADTTSVVYRNSIADVTFYDSASFISNRDLSDLSRFPFMAAGKRSSAHPGATTVISGNLKDGWHLPVNPIHNNWLIVFLLIAVLLSMLVKNAVKSFLSEAARFFLLRGMTEFSSRDAGTLFYRESAILSLVTFIIISLFVFCTASWFEIIPQGMSATSFIIVTFLSITAAITVRHVTCVITGKLSGKSEVFNEYLVNIYQTYRFFAIPAFIFVVMLVYTPFFKPQFYFAAGAILIIIIYIYRILRLFVIFMKRNISIFYLFLYLCALEFLPVLLLVKYVTGQF